MAEIESFIEEFRSSSPHIEVKTSGSTGTPKRMLVEKSRMLASAKMTCDFLGLKEGDIAYLCMSTDYIAGKMMIVRAIERHLHLISTPPTGHPFLNEELRRFSSAIRRRKSMKNEESLENSSFTAIVPLQLYNTLQFPSETAILKSFNHVIIGGGAISPETEEKLRDFPNALWASYGMTETLSHIALRRLSGPDATDWFQPLPGISLSQDADDCLIIDAPSLNPEKLHTNDIVELLDDSRFRIIGRRDNIICSGGIKLQIEEIETALRPHLSSPFLITKRKDEKFGEIVVLLTESTEQTAHEELTRASSLSAASAYSKPRLIIHVDHLPLTETGKPARKLAEEIAKK